MKHIASAVVFVACLAAAIVCEVDHVHGLGFWLGLGMVVSFIAAVFD